MNTTSEGSSMQNSDAVESLLEKAEPRPAPPPQMEADVRAAVQSEWAAVSGRQRRWRTGRNVALAASVLLAVVFAFTSLQQSSVPAIEVALLDQSKGTIRLHSNESGTIAEDTSTLFAGQTLQTGSDSAAGLAWAGGGSLRVDEQTRIEFISSSEIFLHNGRVYFDSLGTGDGGSFAVQTEHGLVTHIGTQYMTESNDSGIVVSVREGEVLVAGTAHDQTVHRGPVSPSISVDGMTAFDFLQWVGRETGYSIHFSSEAVDELVRSTELKGSVDADPRTELRLRMMTMDLEAQFNSEGAVISVSD
jgi:hypothetical protein